MLRHISGRAYQSFNYTNCVISAGLAFETTTSKSQGGPKSTGCGIYAGHWLYKAGTRLRQGVGANDTTLPVENPGRIRKGMYVVIYDAPAGSFHNAEHARVTGVNSSSKTITVRRGYKSKQIWHSSGSIVAEHVLGQGDDAELWAFNLSTASPRDGNGWTFGEFYADWIGQNLLRHGNGIRTSADVAGVMFDADFYFDYSSTSSDANNDLVVDNGVGPHGQNWLGNGLDEFYQRVKQRLPGYYVLVGVHDARGFDSAQGGQMESWLDYGNDDFNPNPKYAKVSKLFAAYLFNMSERRDGPPLVMNLTKTPTREYPAGTSANSNAAFRLALTMTLLEDGYFGTHTLKDPDVWWDEYAVDVRPGSANFGKAVRKGDIDGIHQHRGWLGKPLAPFRRVYNDADFAPAKSLIGANTFDQGLNGWDSTNVSISRVTTGARDGSGALRASEMKHFTENEMGAFVKSKNFSVSGGATYTLAFSARASETREIRVAVGNDSYRIAVGKEWRRYVLTFRPTQSGATAVKFGLGREDSQVWLDSAYLFKRNADVFQRQFDNGMVLANATGSSKTISIGPGFRHINGTQDPVNDGTAVSRITLPPYDGIVLVRDGDAGSPGNGKIGDLVWRDVDGDGRQDGNESGWTGITVKLRKCNGNVIADTQTNAQRQIPVRQTQKGQLPGRVRTPRWRQVQSPPGRRRRTGQQRCGPVHGPEPVHHDHREQSAEPRRRCGPGAGRREFEVRLGRRQHRRFRVERPRRRRPPGRQRIRCPQRRRAAARLRRLVDRRHDDFRRRVLSVRRAQCRRIHDPLLGAERCRLHAAAGGFRCLRRQQRRRAGLGPVHELGGDRQSTRG